MMISQNINKRILNILVMIFAMLAMTGLQQSVHAENVKGTLTIHEDLNDIDASTKQVKSTVEVTDDHNGASYVSSPSLADYFDYVDGKINVTTSTIKSVTLKVNGVEQTLNASQYHFVDNKIYAGVQTSGLEINDSVTSNIKMAKGEQIILTVNIDRNKIENNNVLFRTNVNYYWNYINTIAVDGQKTWVDNNNKKGLRPNNITVNLLRNGTKIDSKVVDEAANWKYTFIDLPVSDKDNNPYTYTISENTVNNYTTKIDGNNLTNTLVDNDPSTNTPTMPANPSTNTPTKPANPGTNTPTKPTVDNNDKTHDETDGNVVGGDTNSSSDLGTTNSKNQKSKNVEKNNRTLLPKTGAQNLTLAGIVSVMLASMSGLVVWKKSK
ncbi:Cna B-type domain-containing protein [Weissella coleopterorum]|uniref:Cna B-type domain-containing protein n=1 Tax=Weissella coleopterorum TaxID=2714949 RepID=A0A6G8B1V5_9LACO|nr:Cna B-type domain-containing protein [Weissella coleopterorum]QIL51294.1 Cna B-type domain-containing protein [Weissella coleopterorum]